MVTVSQLPSGAAVPLFYAQVSNDNAGVFTVNGRRLIIGQKLPAGSAAVHVPLLVNAVEEAWGLFGRGSHLARLVAAYRKTDPYGELYCIAVADDGAGVAAIRTVTFAGAATEAGQHSIYIGMDRIRSAVLSGDSANAQATAFAAAVNAEADLMYTAAAVNAVVSLTCRHKGECGNDAGFAANFLGQFGGEKTPAGASVAFGVTTAGSANPVLTGAIAAMGDDPYDYIVCPYLDATSLNALRDEMGSRWSPMRMVYGHVFSGKTDSVANLTALADARNDPALSLAGTNYTPWSPAEMAASFAATAAPSLEVDPALPVHTLQLVGGLAPSKAYTFVEKQTLIDHGVTPITRDNTGQPAIVSAVTTYTKNAYGARDRSYQNLTTRANLTFIIRFLQSRITQKFGRHKLANDGARFGPGQRIVTPNIIRAELVAAYGELMVLGLVENIEAFKAGLIVERDQQNPDRVNILFAPDLVNELKVIGMLVAFRQQYPQYLLAA